MEGVTEGQMAQDALRFRLQQAARMEPREFAEAALKDRLGLKTLDAIVETATPTAVISPKLADAEAALARFHHMEAAQ